MRKISIPFLVVALSLMVTGMAFAIDIPNISTWTQSMGVGGGGPGIGDLLLAPLYDVRAIVDPNLGTGGGEGGGGETPAALQEGGGPGTIARIQYTLINIVNTDPLYGVIARIRFREWKRSDEVLDFDIPLSCNDVWVGELSRNEGGGGIINSPDRWVNATPTSTYFPSAAFPTAGIPFSTGAIPDGTASEKLARTEYGYFELIGEERVVCKMDTATGRWTRLADGLRDVPDVLMAQVYILRPEVAISHQYNMNAYSDFAVNPSGIWEAPQTGRPNLFSSVQGEGTNPGVGGFDQLEAIMSKRFVLFQYVNGTPGGTPMSTSTVITLPTKWLHYSASFIRIPGPGNPDWTPFTGYYETPTDGDKVHGGEVIRVLIYDRAENTFVPPENPISPGQPLTVEILPWEVNVIGLLPEDPLPDAFARGFRDNVLIATKNNTSAQTFNEGWGIIDLSPGYFGTGVTDPRTTSPGPGFSEGESGIIFNFFGNFFTQYRGLPAIGIVMTEFFNDSVNGYYGNTVPWNYVAAWGEAPANLGLQQP